MTAAALFQRHQGIAHSVARNYWLRGADRDDVRQEARLALWEACQAYDPAKGSFPPFARLVINRKLSSRLKVTMRHHAPATDQAELVAAPERQEGLLDGLLAALPSLTVLERQALADFLNGVPTTSSKAHENALHRARRKLREAA